MYARTRPTLMIPTLLAAAILLAGCAGGSQPAADAVAWEQGATRGWIVKFYTPATAREDLPACLQALPASALADRHYALVGYWRARRTRHTVAELPAGFEAGVDDAIEVWPADCAAGRFARVSRKLAPVFP